jgi:8-oxo-dGTP pyrophosphatase MutT (NUDIX family)
LPNRRFSGLCIDMSDDVPKAPAGTTVHARPAASLLVVRHDGPEPTLLMARRAMHHRFMPGVLVFPGGAVDAADHHARAAKPLAPATAARLHRFVDASTATALAHAAARELTEEVGISLGDPPDLSQLHLMCRAITPPDRAMRFDAYFFLVDAAHTTGAICASDELEEPGWYTVEQAMAANLAGATQAVLMQFQRWMSHHDRDGALPVLRDRQWVLE